MTREIPYHGYCPYDIFSFSIHQAVGRNYVRTPFPRAWIKGNPQIGFFLLWVSQQIRVFRLQKMSSNMEDAKG
ncbi:MAG: hypothetical protein A4E41_01372 [Methanoregulaceae archaeon PtaU1.Bin066]|nr:MAG: hypothetical protein A4E41_01372 [Methanoregulaceae archaeon PtaU1.Bin066]